MEVRSLTARQILDSRGQWTVEAAIVLANGAEANASVPQGKSTGASEAHALPAAQAVRNIIKTVAPKVQNHEFKNQEALDEFLIKLDGTPNKARLGANAILATSIAFLRASATATHTPLWQHIRETYGFPVRRSRPARPHLFMNVINGGLHAGNNLNFQEYLVIPKCGTIKESVEVGMAFYHAVGEMLVHMKGKNAANLGDEGGYAPDFKDDKEPFRVLQAVAKKLKIAKKVDFGMDAAATDVKKLTHKDLEKIYSGLIKNQGLVYLEDPFDEEDFLSFASLTMRYGASAINRPLVWIVGDDLTTTNVRRMERAHAEGSVNAVIIKPNQIGSVTEALGAVRTARKYGWAVIASHRSGETNDDFIADFAYAVGADGLKLGAPARGERIAKYNRLLEIESEL
jgi:enolase